MIDKAPSCVLLVKQSPHKSVRLCLCLPAALFPHVRPLSHVTLQSVDVCTCAANVKKKYFVDGTGSIEHFCCWPLIADGSLCEPPALPLYLCLSRSATTPSATPGHQSPHPVKGLLWQNGHLLYDKHDVAWKGWLTSCEKRNLKLFCGSGCGHISWE